MNKVYQRIWSKIKERWILVDEKVASKGGPSGIVGAITLAAFLSMSGTVSALDPGALPTGGKITAGSGSIATLGTQMTVRQSTQKMVANWDTFNIGKRAGVTFRQPGSDAVALNKIYDQNPSLILGSLSANGKIYLINPSGIVFGEGAQVNVGGLVASSLNMLDSDFLAGKYTFTNNGKAGSVINQGNITAADGGVVALIAPKVTNEGTITANSGSVILGAGNQVTLDFTGDGLISYTLDKGAVDALAANKGLIKADGGLVVMTAKAADSLTGAVVNNSGIIEAQTLENNAGRIMLMSDMASGTTTVSGKLDASAPNGGDGGFIETSANNVKINDNAVITTAAPLGITGKWLIDPYDFTIAASGGDVTGAALSAALGSTDVIIQTLNGSVSCTGVTCGTGNPAGNGDIFVNDSVTWSTSTLTLNAWRNIEINSALFGSGTAQLDLFYGQGAVVAGNTATYEVNAPVNLPAGNNFSTKLGSDGTTINYYVITSLGAQGSNTGTDLQGMEANLSGNFALGSNINASATSTWNAGAGFDPIGSDVFTGKFDGLGHTINNLYINRPDENYVGLFGDTNGAELRNVGLVNAKVTGRLYVGALVGHNNFTNISNSYVSSSGKYGSSAVTAIGGDGATGDTVYVGGLVGYNVGGNITNVSSSATVTGTGGNGSYDGGTAFGGNANVGGLIGYNDGGDITNASTTGAVTGTGGRGASTLNDANGGDANVGGLVGLNVDSDIINASTTGAVRGTGGDAACVNGVAGNANVGGLVGLNTSTNPGGNIINISDTSSTGAVTATGGNSVATNSADGGYAFAGGIIGSSDQVNVNVLDSSSTGAVTATGGNGTGTTVDASGGWAYGGGLVGSGAAVSVFNSSATNRTTAIAGNATSVGGDADGGYAYGGGLVGKASGDVVIHNSNVSASGKYGSSTLTATAGNATSTNGFASGGYVYGGGLVGYGSSVDIANSSTTGAVRGTGGNATSTYGSAEGGHVYVGGLIGHNGDSISVDGNDGADITASITNIYKSYATGSVTAIGGNATSGSTISDGPWDAEGGDATAGGLVGATWGEIGVGSNIDESNVTVNTINISESYATGAVAATGGNATSTAAGSDGAKAGDAAAGGLVGWAADNFDMSYNINSNLAINTINISNSYATGAVTGRGGVATAVGDSISDGYARGGNAYGGGLVGYGWQTDTGSNIYGNHNSNITSKVINIADSFATGAVTATGGNATVRTSGYAYGGEAYGGGLVGWVGNWAYEAWDNDNGNVTINAINIADSSATGAVTTTGGNAVTPSGYAYGGWAYGGGLVGFGMRFGENYGDASFGVTATTVNIANSFATGAVRSTGGFASGTWTMGGDATAGGLVGYSEKSSDIYNYGSLDSTITVTDTDVNISNSHTTGAVTATGGNATSSTDSAYGGYSYAGGLVGQSSYYYDEWSDSSGPTEMYNGLEYANNGDVTATINGINISDSYSTGTVTGVGGNATSSSGSAYGGEDYAGGLVGYSESWSVIYNGWMEPNTGIVTSITNGVNIFDSFATGTVNGRGGSATSSSASAYGGEDYAGGLVGYASLEYENYSGSNSGDIMATANGVNFTESFATGTVTATGGNAISTSAGAYGGDAYAGGLVGYGPLWYENGNYGSGNITNTSNAINISDSYATRAVTAIGGNANNGGLWWYSRGGDAYAGGLVGYNYGQGEDYNDISYGESQTASAIANTSNHIIISKSYATGAVTARAGSATNNNIGWAYGGDAYAGGLVGYNYGQDNSWSGEDGSTNEGNVTTALNGVDISKSYATGAVTARAGSATNNNIGWAYGGDAYAGGLVGYNNASSSLWNGWWNKAVNNGAVIFTTNGVDISDSHATGAVTATAGNANGGWSWGGWAYGGGLVGYNYGENNIRNGWYGVNNGAVTSTISGVDISDSFATGSVTATAGNANGGWSWGGWAYGGGLVGYNYGDTYIENGGWEGLNSGAVTSTISGVDISDSFATGSVTATAGNADGDGGAGGGDAYVGGLVGYNNVSSSLWNGRANDGVNNGAVTSTISDVDISYSFATGKVTATAGNANSGWWSSGGDAYAGGLVGYNNGEDNIGNGYEWWAANNGAVTFTISDVDISYSFATGSVTATAGNANSGSDGWGAYGGDAYAGGLVGYNNGEDNIWNGYLGSVNNGAVTSTISGVDISDSYATGAVTATAGSANSGEDSWGGDAYAGGLVGDNNVSSSLWNGMNQKAVNNGAVTSTINVVTISDSNATGAVTATAGSANSGEDSYGGNATAGGLVGYNYGEDNIGNGYTWNGENNGAVTSTISGVDISKSHATGAVTATAGSTNSGEDSWGGDAYAGGLVGYNNTWSSARNAWSENYVGNSVWNSTWDSANSSATINTGAVTLTTSGINISESNVTGAVTATAGSANSGEDASGGDAYAGGLVGYNNTESSAANAWSSNSVWNSVSNTVSNTVEDGGTGSSSGSSTGSSSGSSTATNSGAVTLTTTGMTISDSHATGAVTGKAGNASGGGWSWGGWAYSGGLVGYNNTESSATNASSWNSVSNNVSNTVSNTVGASGNGSSNGSSTGSSSGSSTATNSGAVTLTTTGMNISDSYATGAVIATAGFATVGSGGSGAWGGDAYGGGLVGYNSTESSATNASSWNSVSNNVSNTVSNTVGAYGTGSSNGSSTGSSSGSSTATNSGAVTLTTTGMNIFDSYATGAVMATGGFANSGEDSWGGDAYGGGLVGYNSTENSAENASSWNYYSEQYSNNIYDDSTGSSTGEITPTPTSSASNSGDVTLTTSGMNISSSYTTGVVTATAGNANGVWGSGGDAYAGGLVGSNYGFGEDIDYGNANEIVGGNIKTTFDIMNITDSFANGAVTAKAGGPYSSGKYGGTVNNGGTAYAGGLVGEDFGLSFGESDSGGNVTSIFNSMNISDSHANGAVTATAGSATSSGSWTYGGYAYAGGLVGEDFSLASGQTTGSDNIVDITFTGMKISDSHALGAVTATAGSATSGGSWTYGGYAYAGGLVGEDFSLASGQAADSENVTTTFSGMNISNSHANGAVTGTAGSATGVSGGAYGGWVYAGGLVGYTYNPTLDVSNSYATGAVKGTGGRASLSAGDYGIASGGLVATGGLIGYNVSYYDGETILDPSVTISGSYATGAVTSIGGSASLGGTVEGHGSVTGGLVSAGGLVGVNFDGSLVIYGSRATGAVTGTAGSASGISDYGTSTGGNVYTGGLVAYSQYGVGIIDSHATGAVTGTSGSAYLMGDGGSVMSGSAYGGGLVGYNKYGSLVWNSYATGPVTVTAGNATLHCDNGMVMGGSASGGGLIGNAGDHIVWDSYATGQVAVTAGNAFGGGDGDMVMGGSASGGGLIGRVTNTNTNIDYDIIGDSYATGAVSVRAGSASSSGAGYGSSAYGGSAYGGGLVGNSKYGDIDITDSYSTGRVTVTAGSASTGAFGTATGGDAYGGGLVGSSKYGDINIDGSHATGAVTATAGSASLKGNNGFAYGGYAHAGGLVGENFGGGITTSYATGAVIATAGGATSSGKYGGTVNTGGDAYAGGLVGWNEANITDAYASGAVTATAGAASSGKYGGTVNNGNAYAGGLIGYNDNATIDKTYAAGRVSEADYAGGLVGDGTGSVVTNSFWDTQTTGQAFSYGGTGLATADMQKMSTFSNAGWDITNTVPVDETWVINEGIAYPLLTGL